MEKRPGITRFNITDAITGAGEWRFIESQKRWPTANALYQRIFTYLGMPLLPGEETISCTKAEFEAGYDYQLGIDVVLRPKNQGESTMQEKFLFTDYYSATVEHCQDWLNLEPGDWFHLKAQYYFVGYDPHLMFRGGCFDPWVLLDWVCLQRATAQRRVKWNLRGNLEDGARSSFMYVYFRDIPGDVIATSSNDLRPPTHAVVEEQHNNTKPTQGNFLGSVE